MNTKEMLHIYTRVSTEAQEEKGTSLDSQKALGIEAAKKLNLQHTVWNEGGASSFYEDFSNRPVLLDLLRKIEAGEVQHLWVYNNDRLSRNEFTAQTIRAALRKHNVILYTKDGTFNLNNPQDNFMKTILDGVAALDNAMRTDRTRMGKLNKVKQGYWMGGPPPFGYRIEEKRLALHSEESVWVGKIFQWYSEGKSIQQIKSELQKKGVKTNRGSNTWSLGSINKILQNTHPLGTYSYTDAKTDETVECTCPPIVNKSLWNACQAQRKKILERKGQNNRTRRFYLLRNLLYCGHCGSPMAARTKESKQENLYYCPRREKDWKKVPPEKAQKWVRSHGCSMTRSLNIPMTDRFVWSTVVADLFKSNYIQKAVQEFLLKDNINRDPQVNIKRHQNILQRLRKEKARLIDDIAAVETAKILGQQDKVIVDKVSKNLRQILLETDGKIEQAEFHMAAMQQKSMWHTTAARMVVNTRSTATIDVASIVDIKERKRRLEKMLEKIVVFYHKEKNEHELKFHFKIPLLQEYEAGKEHGGKIALKKTAKSKAKITP
jgi:DNA invertase Pin-like site-specific DNA recombinase